MVTVKKNSEPLMEKHGYGTEAYEIQTEDGYILTLIRIFKKSEIETKNRKKPLVLIVHGFLCSGQHWCLNSPNKVLPYLLIEEGYDCWLANLRGSPLSRGHVNKRYKSKSYWDFSFHEIGLYDIPAIINHILEVTGSESLSYIGHSMGCAVLIVALSSMPDYCSKINVMVALAPAVYGKHIRNIRFKPLISLGNLIGKSKFIRNRILCELTMSGCAKRITFKSQSDGVGAWLIKTVGVGVGAFGTTQVDDERLKTVASVWPSPTSLKVFCHGVQCFKSGKVRQYDYGVTTNTKMYGQPKPPEYDLAKVKIPVATFYSDNDELSRPKDVTRLANELPNSIGNYGINHPGFSHIDFMLGKDADELVYKKVIQIISNYKQ